MEVETLLEFADSLFFEKNGKHLNDLQVEVIKGAIARRKYAEIAEYYHCTEGHVKDVAYQLWQLLSNFLGEEVNKSNLISTLERRGILNNVTSNIVFGDISDCSALSHISIGKEDKEGQKEARDRSLDFEKAKQEAKREIIPKLKEAGLTLEQIARVLDMTLGEIDGQKPDKNMGT